MDMGFRWRAMHAGLGWGQFQIEPSRQIHSDRRR